MKYAINTATDIYGDQMYAIKISHVRKAGENFIKRKPDAKAVYVINHYDKETNSFSCSDYDNMNKEIFIKACQTVYVGFSF